MEMIDLFLNGSLWKYGFLEIACTSCLQRQKGGVTQSNSHPQPTRAVLSR